jgi:predicted flap endonuclease-1-like 5' DNA nuclease
MAIATAELKGITADLAAKLKEHGLKDSEAFLEAAKTPKGRQELAKKTGASEHDVLQLANRADLARVKGVAGVFADLLEAAGVDTVKELAQRVPAKLHAKLEETNNEKKISGRTPRLDEVENWVAQAKDLPKTLEY